MSIKRIEQVARLTEEIKHPLYSFMLVQTGDLYLKCGAIYAMEMASFKLPGNWGID